MQISTGSLDAAIAALRFFEGRDLRDLDGGELLEAQDAAARVRRLVEATQAGVAGEVARRSTPHAGAGGLARQHGFGSPVRLVAQATGGSLGDAARLIEAGRAMSADDNPDLLAGDETAGVLGCGSEPGTGGTAPRVRHPHIASALERGAIGVEAAAMIARTLDALDGDTDRVERGLVAAAERLALAELRRACQRAQAVHDPAAWEERERRQHANRYALTEDHEGMMVLTARLDPPSAAPVKAWLDAQVKDAFRRRRNGDPLDPDTRSAGQIRADALVSLARHGLACDEPTAGVSTTLIIRMGMEELRSGLGIGESDDVTTPLSAGALRAMAVDAEIIPEVLGGEGEVLDLGRAKRLFTRAQRLALVERDGGCASCHAPPSYCEAHHIRWWDRHRGRTDLLNGVLLCTGCHHRVHRDGWEIEVREGTVWFTPPVAVDPSRTPRLGGRANLSLAA